MLKVFLVEDEFIIREGIKNNIPWNEHGFLFCGEASDGELAYSQIRLKKPDIIITDIKMPFMNGLELSRLIKKDNTDAKIIILSGYGEFELAKEAINIGIEEYILKPVNADDLIGAVKRVGQKIMAERKEKENLLKFQKEMKENEVLSKRNFFIDLINNKQSLADLLTKSRKLGIDLFSNYYNVILFKITGLRHKDESFSNTLVKIWIELSQYLEKNQILWFDRSLEGTALILKGDTKEELEQFQNKLILEMEAILKKYSNVAYFGGIGCTVNRVSELSISFEEASRAFAYRFLTKECKFLFAGSIEECSKEKNPWADITGAEYQDKEIVDKFLRTGEIGEVNYFVEEYFKNYVQAGTKSIIFRQYIIMDMYFITVNFIEKLGMNEFTNLQEPFQSPYKMDEIVTSYENTIAYIKKLFLYAITCRNEAVTRKFCNIVEETKDYINANYGNEELSLNTAASFVNISPSYLSSMFSQETGQTFVKYLTDVRMSKAKELLSCTNKRCSEISLEVGYKDPHYFSYLFKKTQGCTPLQFRMNKSRNEVQE